MKFNAAIAANTYFVQPNVLDKRSDVFFLAVEAPKYYNIRHAKEQGVDIFDEKKALGFVRKLITITTDASIADLVYGGANATRIAVNAANEPFAYLYTNLQKKGKQTLPRYNNISDPFFVQKKISEEVELDSKIDTWGIGEVLYEILSTSDLAEPIDFADTYRQMNNETAYHVATKLSVEVLDVLNAALKFDPANRADLLTLQKMVDEAIAKEHLTYNETVKTLNLGTRVVPPGPNPGPEPKPESHILRTILIILLILLVIGLAIYFYNNYRKNNQTYVKRNDQLAADMLI